MRDAKTPTQNIHSLKSGLRVGASVSSSAKWAFAPPMAQEAQKGGGDRCSSPASSPWTLLDSWVRPARPLPQPQPLKGAPRPGLRRPRPLLGPATYG